jgi:hypothetical protein
MRQAADLGSMRRGVPHNRYRQGVEQSRQKETEARARRNNVPSSMKGIELLCGVDKRQSAVEWWLRFSEVIGPITPLGPKFLASTSVAQKQTRLEVSKSSSPHHSLRELSRRHLHLSRVRVDPSLRTSPESRPRRHPPPVPQDSSTRPQQQKSTS